MTPQEFCRKGNSGDDTFNGSTDTTGVTETFYGGQGDDTITNSAGTGARSYYGDKGDDATTIVSDKTSLASGGDGADSITVATLGTAKETHSIDGALASTPALVLLHSVTLMPTTLLVICYPIFYSSFAEFHDQGEVVDKITITDSHGLNAVISGALTITDSDEFENVAVGAGDRTAEEEGLVMATASTVTAGSTITFASDAYKRIAGVDLSAGTTGNSVINNSAAVITGSGTGTNDTFGMLLKGGAGKNTIAGGDGIDAIVGADQNDSLVGNACADQITIGAGLKDTVSGGAGNDSIVMSTNLATLMLLMVVLTLTLSSSLTAARNQIWLWSLESRRSHSVMRSLLLTLSIPMLLPVPT